MPFCLENIIKIFFVGGPKMRDLVGLSLDQFYLPADYVRILLFTQHKLLVPN